MAITSVWCPVLGARVTRVADLEGSVTKIICGEYDESNRSCRLMKAATEGGPLTQLLEHVAEDTLRTRSTLCVLRV
jgi:hypothetical protein